MKAMKAMKAKEYLRRSIQGEIDSRQQQLRALSRLPVNLFCQAFPEGSWSASWGGGFEFTLPFNFVLIEQIKQFVSEQFPEYELKDERRHVWDESKAAGHFLEYSTKESAWSDRSRFEIAFRTQRAGTTCVLNQIGEKKIPIFEVICSEGAKETL